MAPLSNSVFVISGAVLLLFRVEKSKGVLIIFFNKKNLQFQLKIRLICFYLRSKSFALVSL